MIIICRKPVAHTKPAMGTVELCCSDGYQMVKIEKAAGVSQKSAFCAEAFAKHNQRTVHSGSGVCMACVHDESNCDLFLLKSKIGAHQENGIESFPLQLFHSHTHIGASSTIFRCNTWAAPQTRMYNSDKNLGIISFLKAFNAPEQCHLNNTHIHPATIFLPCTRTRQTIERANTNVRAHTHTHTSRRSHIQLIIHGEEMPSFNIINRSL